MALRHQIVAACELTMWVLLVGMMITLLTGCTGKMRNDGEVYLTFGTTITLGQRIPGNATDSEVTLDLADTAWDALRFKWEKEMSHEEAPAVPVELDPPLGG